MTTAFKRLLNSVLHTPGLRRRLCIRIMTILSLASVAWLFQQSYSSVGVDQAPDSSVTVKSLQLATSGISTSSRKRRLFVRLPDDSARLGNRMFAHATLLGLAARTGLNATVLFADDKNILSSTFSLTTPVVTDKSLVQLHKVEWPWKTAVYVQPPSNLTHGVSDDEDVLLTGYFQSWRYFQYVDERVRAEFRFKKHVADEAASLLRQLTANYTRSETSLVLVGIQVRRGDMTFGNHVERGYTVADEHYIRRAMNYVTDRVTIDNNVTSLLYVVCTDDDRWARDNVHSTSYPVVFTGLSHRKAEVDLAVLASCNHVITTVGTYSWWAGYLHSPGGITVYYKGFPKPGTEIANGFNAQDFFPPGWIGLL